MRLDQAFPDGIPKGIRVSLYDLKMHVPLVSEGTQLGDTGEKHVPSALRQVSLSHSRNWISPQTHREVYLAVTRLSCVIMVD